MSRNENSLFSQLPSVNIGRSKMNRPQNITFTGNVGVLIPYYWDEVLPGDTMKIKTNKVCRLQTPITPFMSQLYLDTYYFFVPNRLIWTHWKEFMGENSTAPWVPSVSYSVPQFVPGSNGYSAEKGSVPDYLGVPIGVPLKYSALPIRAYYAVFNDWFRDENLQYPVNFNKGDTDTQINNVSGTPNDGSAAYSGNGRPMMVSKYHDYFTSALPGPLKAAQPVTLALTGNVPVHSYNSSGNYSAIIFNAGTGHTAGNVNLSGTYQSDGTSFTVNQSSESPYDKLSLGANSNVYADLSSVSVATVAQLRTAFQLQKLLETDSRAGSRYTEVIRAHFGVVSPDARLQRPEYLGGNRIPLNVHQVVQNSETGTTPQGTTAAYSLTVDQHFDFERSFTEHGIIIGVACVRYDHTYQQGLERAWSRKTRYDYYWPVFAHLSETGIKNKEIFAQGESVVDAQGNVIDEQVFGYQEAWAEYRYKPNRLAGEMRSDATNSLDVWHLGDDYPSLPALSAGWIVEDKSNVDRVLQVKSTVADQLLFDFYVQNTSIRPLPLHSIPGLVDHF